MVNLSPSRTSTFLSCSLKYWYNYKGHDGDTVGIPSDQNQGSQRGSTVHDTLECLSHPKRRKRVEAMIAAKDPWIDKPTKRLAFLLAKKNQVSDPENFEMVRGFILTALNSDFFCTGSKSVEIERHFKIQGEGFQINGFLDKIALYEDEIKIIDYKTSKKKFTKDELSFNLQNFFYTYAATKLWPGKPISFEFQFLKFPKSPIVEAPKISKEQLDGFSEWLVEISKHIDSLTFDQAKSNTPKDKGPGKDWVCGKKQLGALNAEGVPAWYCDFRKPFIYFALSREGKTIKTSKSKSELEKIQLEGDLILQCSHPGCFAWRHELKNKS